MIIRALPTLAVLAVGCGGLALPAGAQIEPPNRAVTDFSTRKIEFRAEKTDPSLALSPVTVFPPHCSTDGYLYVDMLNPHDLSEHTVVGVRGESSRILTAKQITDLHDIRVLDFYPTDSAAAFLVHASKESPGQKGPGKSPAGMPWESYHDYIAKFDDKGSYTGSTEVPTDYPNSHFALLPSGDAVVLGFDATNAALQVIYIDDSGKLIKKLDTPASRDRDAVANAALSTGEMTAAGNQFVGSIFLTGFKDKVLIWRRNNEEAIVEVGQGGAAREVPLPKLKGYQFVDLITANDRWVAHYRSEDARQNDFRDPENFVYFDLRPQDGSIASRLMETGQVPYEIACESDGKYIAFIYDKDNKLMLVTGE